MNESTAGWVESLATLTRMSAPAVLDRVPVPIVAVDANHVVVYANPAFAVLLGRPGDHFDGATLGSLLREPISRAASEFRPGAVLNFDHAEDLEVRAKVSSSAALLGPDGGCLYAFEDVTAQAWEGRGLF